MQFENLQPELTKKARECQTPEEILKLAEEEGIELSDQDLEQVSGGWGDDDSSAITCLDCGSANVEYRPQRAGESYAEQYICRDCGFTWTQMY